MTLALHDPVTSFALPLTMRVMRGWGGDEFMYEQKFRKDWSTSEIIQVPVN